MTIDPKLVDQWESEWPVDDAVACRKIDHIAQRAYEHGIEQAQEACKAADLKAEAKGVRLTLTAANQIIGALKGTK